MDSVPRCQVCGRIVSEKGITHCSEECLQASMGAPLSAEQTVDALTGRLLGRTSFESVLGNFADAMAEFRRAYLVAGSRRQFRATMADQTLLARTHIDVGNAHPAFLKAALAIGEMMSAVRAPGSAGGSKAEGANVQAAVTESFPRWTEMLKEPSASYPNDFFTQVATAIAPFFAGRGNVNETFSGLLELLRNYSATQANSAEEKVRRREFVKSAKEQGAKLDKAYAIYMESLKAKPKAK